MEFEKKALKKLIKTWAGVLRLRDWDIRHSVVSGEWRKRGDIKIDLSNSLAEVLVHESVSSENLEELVIHELLHLKLYAMDQMIEELINLIYGEDEEDAKRTFAYGQFMQTLEITVEDLTKALLEASCSPGKMSFRRVREQVERELSQRD